MAGPKKLYRSMKNKMIAGVCSGLGEFFSIDPTIIRLVWAFIVLCAGTGIFLYIVAWIIVPAKK
ncbi:MAG: PspC domain-containing protein [bacterium]|nr:PspC domain-containing protein [bacterium]